MSPSSEKSPITLLAESVLKFRSASVADISLLRSLAERIWREYYPAIIGTAQVDYMLPRMYSEAVIRDELAAGVIWEIAELDSQPIAFSSITLESDGRAKLNKLYLAPEMHGRGHGQQLIKHALETARCAGANELWLQVNKQNSQAIRAYERAGFHVAKEAVFDIGGGFVMDDYLMVRDLSS